MQPRHFVNLILTLLIYLTACPDRPDPTLDTEAEKQIVKLVNKNWRLIKVTRDGTDLTNDFTGFTIAFSGTVGEGVENVSNGTFRTNNGLAVFPASGPWQFQSGRATSELLLANRPTSYTLQNNDTQLELRFFYTEEENSRIEGISGEYVFTLEATP